MSRKPTTTDVDVREAVERGMPGWELAPEADAARVKGAAKADFVGKDIDALKEKYLGVVRDAGPRRLLNDDAKFYQAKPKSGDGPVRSRKVVVAGKEIVGFQG